MSADTWYAFRAVRRDGTVETGVVAAPSREAAAALVGSRGVYPIEISRRNDKRAATRASSEDLALGLRALGKLLEAGFPTARALAVLEGLVPPCWTAVLPAVRSRVEQGDSLAAALRASSLPLPAHVLGILDAGEAGSGMAAAVDSAAQLLEVRASTAAALWNALSYPLLLSVTGTASVALLIGTVLPRFAELLADAGQALPPTTRIVLAFGNGVRAGALPGIVCGAAALVAWQVWVARPAGRKRWHAFLLGLPALGTVRRSAATANACSTLAALLRAGVQLAAAVPLAARSAGDTAVEAALLAARARMIAGEPFSSALQAERALTATSIRFVRIGEESGELSEMLQHAAQIESASALQRVKRAIRLVEPALILLFGGAVMAVASALLQAVYGLRPSF